MWTPPQIRWLKRIADSIREDDVIDRARFDEGAYGSEGGFSRIDRVFEGKLTEVVAELQDQVWKAG